MNEWPLLVVFVIFFACIWHQSAIALCYKECKVCNGFLSLTTIVRHGNMALICCMLADAGIITIVPSDSNLPQMRSTPSKIFISIHSKNDQNCYSFGKMSEMSIMATLITHLQPTPRIHLAVLLMKECNSERNGKEAQPNVQRIRWRNVKCAQIQLPHNCISSQNGGAKGQLWRFSFGCFRFNKVAVQFDTWRFAKFLFIFARFSIELFFGAFFCAVALFQPA